MDDPQHVTVRVPASSANLGTGFDAVGVALRLYATVAVAIDGDLRGNRSPMIKHIRAGVAAAYEAAGREPPEPKRIRVAVDAEFPLGRGLGASAASRAAGLVAANAILGEPLDDQQLLGLGAALERHADNIAPALFGGCQVVAMDGPRVNRVALPVAPGLRFVGFTPSFGMSTQKGRALLPQHLSRADAVHNSCRSALLAAALATGSWQALDAAVDDRLHQRPRSQMFPAMFDFFDAVTAAGAHAAYLSGGGSTLMALAAPDSTAAVQAAFNEAAAQHRIEGTGFITEIDPHGATVQ